jgi:hypothetical protein
LDEFCILFFKHMQKTTTMKPLHGIIAILIFGCMPSLKATDTCIVNDVCLTAIDFPHVDADFAYVCFQGCNMYASPDPIVDGCYMDDFPTVWYRVTTDDHAIVMNIELYSADVAMPAFALFSTTNGCDELEQISLAQGSDCIIGTDGIATVIGVPIEGEKTYYVAVSSVLSVGGTFDLCISTLSIGFVCVIDRNIEITARSNGGPLEGPFSPNETISICLNVNEYTAAGNGCQWFQGMVPVFGNGWDPSSFDANGQPLDATVNDTSIYATSNGIYSASTWTWDDSVGYHHDHPTYNIADFDGNGRIEMCNSAHEMDCPVSGGIAGGCCNPCFANSGTILPAGWFARGINGSCPDTNYIAEEWGDGNTCGSGMGPWSFCFDLVTRDVDDCMTDSTYSDLTLGFYTFADGEVGAWTGGASVCGLDVPAKISMIGLCGRIATGGNDDLPEHCHGDTLRYMIDDENITDWEWNISPFTSVPYTPNQGKNGFVIESPLVNESDTAVQVTATLVGRTAGSNDVLIRKFNFNLQPNQLCETTSINAPGANQLSDDHMKLIPVLAHDRVKIELKHPLASHELITVFDVNARPVMQFTHRDFTGLQKLVDVAHLSDGIYVVTLSSANAQLSKRLIKI